MRKNIDEFALLQSHHDCRNNRIAVEEGNALHLSIVNYISVNLFFFCRGLRV